MAKIVKVEWMQPTREFQCPCCSAKALNAEGQATNEPCSHFLFNWDGQREDFVDFSDDVESILDDPSKVSDSPISESLVSSLSDSAVIYHITTRDEALGPIVRTDAIAFDPLAA